MNFFLPYSGLRCKTDITSFLILFILRLMEGVYKCGEGVWSSGCMRSERGTFIIRGPANTSFDTLFLCKLLQDLVLFHRRLMPVWHGIGGCGPLSVGGLTFPAFPGWLGDWVWESTQVITWHARPWSSIFVGGGRHDARQNLVHKLAPACWISVAFGEKMTGTLFIQKNSQQCLTSDLILGQFNGN